MKIRLVLLAAVAALTVLLTGTALSSSQQTQTLLGIVGTNDRFVIGLTDEAGRRVRVLRAGTYTIRIDDRSAMHNFHLRGPGVNIRTEVSAVGETTRTVTFRPGTYTFMCNPHPSTMSGRFRVEGAGGAAPLAVTARMDARQEVPRPRVRPRRPTGLFTGSIRRRSGATGSIRWRLTFRSLTGRALAAHIHLGRRGRAGAVVAPLCGPCRSGMRGTARLSARALRAVLGGTAYVNVHTRRNQAGEIRGQLRRAP